MQEPKGLIPLNLAYRPITIAPSIRSNIAHALGLGHPSTQERDEAKTNGHFIVVAGGPSLARSLPALSQLANRAENMVISVNEVSHFLMQNLILVHAAAHFGPNHYTKLCIGKPRQELAYYTASICPPEAFSTLKNNRIILWHPELGIGEDKILTSHGLDKSFLIQGGQTITTRMISLGRSLGYKRFHLFGVDSSSVAQLHAYPTVSPEKAGFITVRYRGANYLTTPPLLGQAHFFQENLKQFFDTTEEFVLHGDGLAPEIARDIQTTGKSSPILVNPIEFPGGQIIADRF